MYNMSSKTSTPSNTMVSSKTKQYRNPALTPQKVTFLEDQDSTSSVTEKEVFKRPHDRDDLLPASKRQRRDPVIQGKEKVKEYHQSDPTLASLNMELPKSVEELPSYKKNQADFIAANSTIAISDDEEDEALLAELKQQEQKYLALQRQMMAAQENRQQRGNQSSYQRWKSGRSLPTEEDLYAQVSSRHAGNLLPSQVSRGRTVKEVQAFNQLRSYQAKQRARQSQEVSGEGSEEGPALPPIDRGINSRGLSYLTVYLSAHQEKDFQGRPVATGVSRFMGPGHANNFLCLINPREDPNPTSARAMIWGAIYMLEDLPDVDLMVYSDMKYFVDAINKGWIVKWIGEGFGEHKHEDLWMVFMEKLREREKGAKWEYLSRQDWDDHPYMRIAAQTAIQTCKAELK